MPQKNKFKKYKTLKRTVFIKRYIIVAYMPHKNKLKNIKKNKYKMFDTITYNCSHAEYSNILHN